MASSIFPMQAEAKGLEFHHERSKSLPVHVRTDEKRLRQILVNLLSNAVKFTASGHIRFAIGYRSQVATFTIEDSGSGIGPDDIEHIFEPFVRGKAEKNRFTPGLGLGLTITKLLTETLGGEIKVTSAVGQGTSFQVRLGISKVERPRAQLASASAVTGYDGPRKTLMVVDDNEDHRALMRELLEPLGFDIMLVESGEACLDLMAKGGSPDLFFVDIRMPGMSGWELVARLREQAITAPIIMLSANIGDGANPTSADAGHTDTLAKPIDLAQLVDRLGTHLGLTWRHRDQKPAQRAEKLVSPGAEHLRELASLAQIGHVRGIEARLSALAEDPKNLPLVELLRRHMSAYDFDGFAEVLERVGHEPD
jgi:CheY-like chemotaxis protein